MNVEILAGQIYVLIFNESKGKEVIEILRKKYAPQPLYNTIVGVQAHFLVSYPICVIMKVKCIDIENKKNII